MSDVNPPIPPGLPPDPKGEPPEPEPLGYAAECLGPKPLPKAIKQLLVGGSLLTAGLIAAGILLPMAGSSRTLGATRSYRLKMEERQNQIQEATEDGQGPEVTSTDAAD